MLEILYCFGYILGYVVLVECSSNKVIVGDIIFVGLIGCIDFFQGNYQ